MKELIFRLRQNAPRADGCGQDEPGCHDCYLGALAYDAADALEKLNTLSDELIKEVSWLRSCKNCKIYAECSRHHYGMTVHGCDHWVDVCGERKGNE